MSEIVLTGMGDVILCGCGCGTSIKQFDDRKRPRIYAHGHNITARWQQIKEWKRVVETSGGGR